MELASSGDWSVRERGEGFQALEPAGSRIEWVHRRVKAAEQPPFSIWLLKALAETCSVLLGAHASPPPPLHGGAGPDGWGGPCRGPAALPED